jgi:hypothetical protein
VSLGSRIARKSWSLLPHLRWKMAHFKRRSHITRSIIEDQSLSFRSLAPDEQGERMSARARDSPWRKHPELQRVRA